MKVLITGALGHIGSHLIRTLPRKINCEIIMIDSMETQRYSSLFRLPKKFKYKFIEEDIKNINEFKNKLKKIDIVIHLAALTDALSSVNRKSEFIKNNFNSTLKVVNFCIENNSKLIFVSSTSIYGTQKSLVDENCSSNDLKPQSPYAISKFREENLIKEKIKKYNLKAVILRFGTIFGTSKGMRFHTAVNKFCYQAAKGEKLTVWKTALNQKRPYLDLKDSVDAISFIIRKDIFDNEIYNVLTNNFTVKQLISSIKKKYPNLKFKYVNSPIMNQLSYDVSNMKFKKKGFKFKGNINKGISDTIDLIKKINSHY